jgi:hypothetical protein
MNIKDENTGADRRRARQMILGLGAGLSVPAHLWAQAQSAGARRRQPYVMPEPTPPHNSIAGRYVPSRISGVFDVRTFGAKGDGRALDTPAINRAIEEAARAGERSAFLKAQRGLGGPLFALKGVSDFNLYMSRPLADTHLETVEQQKV